jgi:hypothetical protein
MNMTSRRGLVIGVLLVFAAIALGINFLHTETGPSSRTDCPACQFLTFALSTGPGAAFSVPAILCQGVLIPVEPLSSPEVVVVSLCSRSPPAA